MLCNYVLGRNGVNSHRQAVRDEYRASIKASSSSRDEKLFSQDQPTHAFVAEVFFIFSQNIRKRTSVAIFVKRRGIWPTCATVEANAVSVLQ